MFKLLVVSYGWNPNGFGLHSVVIDFSNFDGAEEAYEELTSNPPDHDILMTVRRLYKVELS